MSSLGLWEIRAPQSGGVDRETLFLCPFSTYSMLFVPGYGDLQILSDAYQMDKRLTMFSVKQSQIKNNTNNAKLTND